MLCAHARRKPKIFKIFDSATTSILAVKLTNPYISGSVIVGDQFQITFLLKMFRRQTNNLLIASYNLHIIINSNCLAFLMYCLYRKSHLRQSRFQLCQWKDLY